MLKGPRGCAELLGGKHIIVHACLTLDSDEDIDCAASKVTIRVCLNGGSTGTNSSCPARHQHLPRGINVGDAHRHIDPGISLDRFSEQLVHQPAQREILPQHSLDGVFGLPPKSDIVHHLAVGVAGQRGACTSSRVRGRRWRTETMPRFRSAMCLVERDYPPSPAGVFPPTGGSVHQLAIVRPAELAGAVGGYQIV